MSTMSSHLAMMLFAMLFPVAHSSAVCLPGTNLHSVTEFRNPAQTPQATSMHRSRSAMRIRGGSEFADVLTCDTTLGYRPSASPDDDSSVIAGGLEIQDWSVSLVGSWSKWLTKHKAVWDAEKQVFEATVTLPLAVHEFKFVVNDHWVTCADYESKANSLGANNVMEVTEGMRNASLARKFAMEEEENSKREEEKNKTEEEEKIKIEEAEKRSLQAAAAAAKEGVARVPEAVAAVAAGVKAAAVGAADAVGAVRSTVIENVRKLAPSEPRIPDAERAQASGSDTNSVLGGLAADAEKIGRYKARLPGRDDSSGSGEELKEKEGEEEEVEGKPAGEVGEPKWKQRWQQKVEAYKTVAAAAAAHTEEKKVLVNEQKKNAALIADLRKELDLAKQQHNATKLQLDASEEGRRQLLFKLQESDARAKEAQHKATELENAAVENKAALEKVASLTAELRKNKAQLQKNNAQVESLTKQVERMIGTKATLTKLREIDPTAQLSGAPMLPPDKNKKEKEKEKEGADSAPKSPARFPSDAKEKEKSAVTTPPASPPATDFVGRLPTVFDLAKDTAVQHASNLGRTFQRCFNTTIAVHRAVLPWLDEKYESMTENFPRLQNVFSKAAIRVLVPAFVVWAAVHSHENSELVIKRGSLRHLAQKAKKEPVSGGGFRFPGIPTTALGFAVNLNLKPLAVAVNDLQGLQRLRSRLD